MSSRVPISVKPPLHDYDVVIEPGALDHITRYLPSAHATAVISDSKVATLYGTRVLQSLTASGATAHLFSFPAGENNKTVQRWEQLSFDLLYHGFGRDSLVVAVGGGVTGDIAGFVAATYMRGIPVVQVPTSLLAMIDASIGGKTGVDAPAGKNLIGAFHQPRIVVIDPHVLRTLPHDELRYGLAEAVKHGAIADHAYVEWIEQSMHSILEHKTHTLTSLIQRSVEIKAQYVSEDVQEAGARAALNFGHTIAHALEHVSNFEIPHGSAVAIGMIAEAHAGEIAGVTVPNTADALAAVLRTVGLPTTHALDVEKIVAATRSDKKTRAATQRYSLIRKLGEMARTRDGDWTTALPDDVVREALTRVRV